MAEPPFGRRRPLLRKHRISVAVVVAVVAVLLVNWLLLTPGRDGTAAVEPASGASLPPTSTSTPAGGPSSVTSPSLSAAQTAGSPAAPSTTMSPVDATQALASLALLAVSDASPAGDYRREQFGQAWSDDVDVAGGHNGCDTRNDILRRDLTAVELKPGTRDCVVLAGVLTDAYTGQVMAFRRGEQTSDDVQIDHLVALSEAWRSGAGLLTEEERRDLANDPVNLQATAGSVNQEKGDADAADWLPPDVSYRCRYVARQIDVKSRYRLSVSTAEKDVMTGTLAGCGGSPPGAMSTGSSTSTRTAATSTRPAPTTSVAAPISASTAASAGSYFANCGQAWAAGAAPLLTGQPGYREDMDGDRDGIACENPP